ncbi:unnamed protein product [Pleuronectes platessa]|uniref:Uncharacterized protein n=1 Tax=Pleuronectes platessa TaxID=8262 RepID=A0A9N7VGY1_PLEPL|nr:unnamed protein product [Pleuronectes platessa]
MSEKWVTSKTMGQYRDQSGASGDDAHERTEPSVVTTQILEATLSCDGRGASFGVCMRCRIMSAVFPPALTGPFSSSIAYYGSEELSGASDHNMATTVHLHHLHRQKYPVQPHPRTDYTGVCGKLDPTYTELQ